MRAKLRNLLGAVCALCLAHTANAELGSVVVGVAPFERVGGQSEFVPDYATLLADRLATSGVDRVVGPEALGAPALARPEEKAVRGWAKRNGATAVVVGRTTQLGRRVSLDVQLRAGSSGSPVATYVAEVARPEDRGAAVDQLASQLVEGLEALSGNGTPRVAKLRRPALPDVAAAPPSAPDESKPSAESDSSAEDSESGSGLFGGNRGGPISIKSDELEARTNAGARHLIFTRNVRVSQDDIDLKSDRLDAFYPPGQSQPEKLVATGHVLVTRRDGEARCRKLTYVRKEQMLHCEGDSQLTRDGDRVRGEVIDWDLTTDTIFVRGGADVFLAQDEDEDSEVEATP